MPKRVLVAGSISLDDVRTPFGEVKGEIGGSGVSLLLLVLCSQKPLYLVQLEGFSFG